MNIIKYLHNKNVCPECGSRLYREYPSREIYCTYCGLLVLDSSFMTGELLDYALSVNRIKKNKDLRCVGRNGDGLKRFML